MKSESSVLQFILVPEFEKKKTYNIFLLKTTFVEEFIRSIHSNIIAEFSERVRNTDIFCTKIRVKQKKIKVI